MNRLVRLNNFWSWLPAFRAVAEHQHLPTAAKYLGVTAPALSRSIRLLEADLGCALFRRTGRSIKLNEAGENLLALVRDGMRLIHEGMLVVQSEQFVGHLNIASAGLMTETYVIPALADLRREHPELIGFVRSLMPGELASKLLDGGLDVAFLSLPLAHERLMTVPLGTETSGVYCGPGHPLHEQDEIHLADVVAHEFVAPCPDELGQTREGWPSDIVRKIGIYADRMRIGLELCARGEYLAVLPDVLATSEGRGSLRRLPGVELPEIHMYAVHRPTIGPSGRAEAMVEAVRRRIGLR